MKQSSVGQKVGEEPLRLSSWRGKESERPKTCICLEKNLIIFAKTYLKKNEKGPKKVTLISINFLDSFFSNCVVYFYASMPFFSIRQKIWGLLTLWWKQLVLVFVFLSSCLLFVFLSKSNLLSLLYIMTSRSLSFFQKFEIFH